MGGRRKAGRVHSPHQQQLSVTLTHRLAHLPVRLPLERKRGTTLATVEVVTRGNEKVLPDGKSHGLRINENYATQ